MTGFGSSRNYHSLTHTPNALEMSKSVSTSLGTIHVEYAIAKPAGVTLAFHHGVFLDGSLWKDITPPLLAAGFNTIVIDGPGHGQSDDPKRSWTLSDSAKVFGEVLDSFGDEIGPVVAVGHSWGGMNSMRLAKSRPDRLAALVLCNTPMSTSTTGARVVSRLQLSVLSFGGKGFYSRQAAAGIYGAGALKAHPEWQAAVVAHFAARPAKSHRRLSSAVLMYQDDGFEIGKELQQRGLPMKVIVGEEDYVLGTYKEKGWPKQMTVIPGNHVSCQEHPDKVVDEIKSFLNDLNL